MNLNDGESAIEQLPEGLYELLETEGLTASLSRVPELEPRFRPVDDEDAPDVLSRHVADAIRKALAHVKPTDRVALANRLLRELRYDDLIADTPSQLHSLHRPDTLKRRQLRRPTTRLSDSALLTNSKDEPNLAAELRAEIGSADTVDLLCAFVRWTGLRLLEPALEQLKERGARLRVITTTYMGATERRAIDELVNRYGAEVKISYETQATRLHAKAWLFRRNTGFDTAYVGSSNLSQAALHSRPREQLPCGTNVYAHSKRVSQTIQRAIGANSAARLMHRAFDNHNHPKCQYGPIR